MTAGEMIRLVDELRPNQYSTQEKLRWLRLMDVQLQQELMDTHVSEDCKIKNEELRCSPSENESKSGSKDDAATLHALLPAYEPDTALLAPDPYDQELYTSWLYSQIDLYNGEIGKYNQSIALLATAWRKLADWINRSRMPKGVKAWKM